MEVGGGQRDHALRVGEFLEVLQRVGVRDGNTVSDTVAKAKYRPKDITDMVESVKLVECNKVNPY